MCYTITVNRMGRLGVDEDNDCDDGVSNTDW